MLRAQTILNWVNPAPGTGASRLSSENKSRATPEGLTPCARSGTSATGAATRLECDRTRSTGQRSECDRVRRSARVGAAVHETVEIARSQTMPPTSNTPAWKKAGSTDRWTEILFRALTSRVARRWRLVSFRGTGGREWRGIVDVLAIRKDTAHSNHDILKSGGSL